MDINDLLKLPIPVLVLVFCNAVGFTLKSIEGFPNKYIPVILFFVGGIIFCVISENKVVLYDVVFPTAYNFVIGCIIGVASVGVHNIFRSTRSAISSVPAAGGVKNGVGGSTPPPTPISDK